MSWQDEWVRHWKEEGLSEDEYPWDELPIVHESDTWEVVRCWRRTACENRPGLKMFYIRVDDENGEPLGGVEIGFDTEPGDSGTIYDHPDIYGFTGWRRGRESRGEHRAGDQRPAHHAQSNQITLHINHSVIASALREAISWQNGEIASLAENAHSQ